MKAKEIHTGQWIADNKVIRPYNFLEDEQNAPIEVIREYGRRFIPDVSYATDLDGIYQAEYLGEVVWQERYNNTQDWVDVNDSCYQEYSCFEDAEKQYLIINMYFRKFLTLKTHPMKEETTPTAGLQVGPQHSYCRIDFINCNMEYDYTICPWHDIPDNLSEVEYVFDLVLDDEEPKPEVKLTPVFMTRKEYEDWFIKNVESNA